MNKDGLKPGFRKRGKRIEYRFYTPQGRMSVLGATERECKEKANQLLTELSKGLKKESSKITLEEYFDEWIKHRVGVKKSTIYSYHYNMKPILKELGDKTLKSIDRRDYRELRTKLLEHYAPSTTNTKLTILSALLTSAKLDGIITKYPTELIEKVKIQPKTEEEKASSSIRALTNDEQQLFFKYSRKHWYYELLALLVSTGIRIGEAGALSWKDIDFKQAIISVNNTMTKVGSNEWEIGSAKTKNGIRKIPITKQTKAILMKQRRKIIDHYGISEIAPDKPVFRSTQTNMRIVSYMGNGAINAILARIEKDNKHIEHFSPHTLRDTFATRFVEQGGQFDTLRDLLGHATIEMTMSKYAHVLPDRKKDQMERVSIVI